MLTHPYRISRLELVRWSHASKAALLMRGWMYTVCKTWRSLVIIYFQVCKNLIPWHTILTLLFSDCSIAPDNVGANTYNTAIAIGEKAAVVIAEDLGIKGVITSEWIRDFSLCRGAFFGVGQGCKSVVVILPDFWKWGVAGSCQRVCVGTISISCQY